MDANKKDIVSEVVVVVRRGRKPIENAPYQDPKYFTNYYHAHLAQVIDCPKCNKGISKQKLKRHQLSSRCRV